MEELSEDISLYFTNVSNAHNESMSTAEAVATACTLAFIIIATVFGNVLVIIAVFNYRPLRSVQNMFIVSLAVADIAVALLVMPLNVAYTLMEQWKFGLPVCKMWLTCDVMCCTASILNLCAIAMDRYWAIHDPINYARKRTLERVMIMIMALWVLSFLISAPPLIGWNDWPEEFSEDTPCMLTEEKGYVIYSASGSFFIPLVIMMTVYVKIFEAAKQRIRVKAKAAANVATAKKTEETVNTIPMKSVATEVSTTAVTEDSSSSTTVSPKTSEEKTETNMTEDKAPENGDKGKTLIRNSRLTSTVRHYMREKQKICLLKERRAARVLGIVMGVFVLCWLPFFLMYVIQPFCHGCHFSKRVVSLVTWLGYVNSALNPVIYTVFNLDFRKAFSLMLCKKR